jgi:hypothetical protein
LLIELFIWHELSIHLNPDWQPGSAANCKRKSLSCFVQRVRQSEIPNLHK